METTKATLDGTPVTDINKDALYFVNWEAMRGVEDLVLIFACMGLSFSGHHPHFEAVKHLLDLSNPVITGQGAPKQPEKADLKLPKLKSL